VPRRGLIERAGGESMSLSEGGLAPTWELPTDGGGRIGTESLKGRPYVLYLYPKDDTPGCTKEALTFTEHYPEFQKLGVEVIGLSKDTVTSHEKFRKKYALCFPLAADDAGAGVVEAFGSWVEKSMYGKKYMGVDRSTFLVGGDGRVIRAWRNVKVPGHVEEVLATARQSVQQAA
jgi:peroxiredoxin Q/BCP